MTTSTSRDRVHFIIDGRWVDAASVDAFYKAFGSPLPGLIDTPIKVICRPSQFARFIIYRDQAGGRNGIKCLQATLVSAQPQETIFDVSGDFKP